MSVHCGRSSFQILLPFYLVTKTYCSTAFGLSANHCKRRGMFFPVDHVFIFSFSSAYFIQERPY